MSDKINIMSKIEELQTTVLGFVGKVDELKEALQKNVSLDKIKNTPQEIGKKCKERIVKKLNLKDYYDKLKENDYINLAKQAKEDLESKFNVEIDKLLNTFGVSSTKDNKEMLEKLEELDKDFKKIDKDVKKLKKDLKTVTKKIEDK